MADPGQGTFDDPSFGQDYELILVASADDLQLPRPGPLDGRQHFRSLVSGVADYPLQERELSASLGQQRLGPVTVLDAGRVNTDAQQQAERVSQDVALAANGLLARVETRGVERRPPF